MSHCPLCIHRDVTLVSFHANLYSDDISRDAAVCTDKLFLPTAILSRNSSVDSMLDFGPGGPGSIPYTDNFFFFGGGGGKLFLIFSMKVKLLTPHPYEMSSTLIYHCSNFYF